MSGPPAETPGAPRPRLGGMLGNAFISGLGIGALGGVVPIAGVAAFGAASIVFGAGSPDPSFVALLSYIALVGVAAIVAAIIGALIGSALAVVVAGVLWGGRLHRYLAETFAIAAGVATGIVLWSMLDSSDRIVWFVAASIAAAVNAGLAYRLAPSSPVVRSVSEL